MICKNCGNVIHIKYCSYCGQEPVKGRLNLKEMARKFVEGFTHVDTGVFRLINKLTVNPGEVVRVYIEGKRKKYYSPVKYLVLVITLSALLTLHYERYDIPFEPKFSSASELDDIAEHQYFNHNYYKYVLFISIPIASLVTWIVFRKSGHNLSENLVLNTYILSQVILLHTILITPLIIYSSSFDDWIISIYMFLAAGYMLWAYITFFKGKWFEVILRSLVALVAFTFVYNFIAHNLFRLFETK